MQTRTMGPGAGWRWLSRGFNLGRNNPRALFGGAALLMLVAMAPSLLQVLVLAASGGTDPATSSVVGLVVMAILAIVFPLLVAGYLRVVHAAEQGRPTRALAVFDAFRAGSDRGRIVATGLLLLLAYLAMFAAVLFLAGGDVADWYWEIMMLAQSGEPGATPDIPPMPEGMGRLVALSLLVTMITGGLYAIALGQVALNGRGVGESLADAVAGTFRNVLPLLVLTVLGALAMVAAFLVVALVVALLAVVGSLVDPMVGVLLAVPVYLVFLLMVYVVMFGVMYYIWLDICGPDSPADAGADGALAA